MIANIIAFDYNYDTCLIYFISIVEILIWKPLLCNDDSTKNTKSAIVNFKVGHIYFDSITDKSLKIYKTISINAWNISSFTYISPFNESNIFFELI